MAEANAAPLIIDYYTDILCVWAWIAERRTEELTHEYGGKIRLAHHCVNVFGDTAQKMTQQWADRDGFDGFAEHVRSSAAGYETAPVHPGLWREVRPTTSATAHLVLKAAMITTSAAIASDLATTFRQAFFIHARDISELGTLLEIATDAGLESAELQTAIASGRAMAALLSDYKQAEAQGIKGSPSWVMNDGRQILYGNLGYRILQANVDELLRHPEQEASWC